MPPYHFTKTILSDYSSTLLAMLRKARVDTGLTQVQAAERLGCRQTFLSKIECGERRIDVVEFSVICLAYGLAPSALLEEFLKRLAYELSTKKARTRPKVVMVVNERLARRALTNHVHLLHSLRNSHAAQANPGAGA